MAGLTKGDPERPEGHAPDPARAEAEIAAVVLGAATEHTITTEDDLYMYRSEYYQRQRRARRVDMLLGFLFAFMVLCFFLLAWRTESNDQASKRTNINLVNGLYNACLQRAAISEQNNIRRESFIQLVMNGPTAPKDPKERVKTVEQLRGALLLPVEDCGEPPRPAP